MKLNNEALFRATEAWNNAPTEADGFVFAIESYLSALKPGDRIGDMVLVPAELTYKQLNKMARAIGLEDEEMQDTYEVILESLAAAKEG
jgi:hypothetical protein